MDDLTDRVRANPANASILAWLHALGTAPRAPITSWIPCGFDEGGVLLFEIAGAALPRTVRHTLGLHNLCIHPATAIIYAVHHGRCTYLLRLPDDPPRRHQPFEDTADGPLDLTHLSPDWHITYLTDDAELLAAHQAAAAPARAIERALKPDA